MLFESPHSLMNCATCVNHVINHNDFRPDTDPDKLIFLCLVVLSCLLITKAWWCLLSFLSCKPLVPASDSDPFVDAPPSDCESSGSTLCWRLLYAEVLLL